MLVMSVFGVCFVSCGGDDANNETPTPATSNEVKVYFVYTLDTSTGDMMTRGAKTNADVFDEFYQKIKTGDLVAPSFELTLTEVNSGVVYSFKGKWNSHDLLTLRTGTYRVVGKSTADGDNIQEKCSFTFDEQIDISITSNIITLHAKYDCSLLIFNNEKIQTLQNFNGSALASFFTFSTYKYAFVNNTLYDVAKKNDAYIIGKYTDDAEFKIFTGNLNFEKGKYYVYNSISNGFDVPPMEEGYTSADYVEVCGVKWAKGNLQYDAINGGNRSFQENWRIASNQWHFYHYNEGVTSYVAQKTDKQVDHFTWGVCGNWSYLHDNTIYSSAKNTDINSKMYVDVDCKTVTTQYEDAKYGDIAYWASKGQYRLPTVDEINALINDASYQYGYYVTSDGIEVHGILFTTPKTEKVGNNQEILLTDSDMSAGLFLPKAGASPYTSSLIQGLNNTGDSYWTSTVEEYPQTLYIPTSGSPQRGRYNSYYGQVANDLRPIRPVLSKQE